jgi:chemotaxis signal transduction protein
VTELSPLRRLKNVIVVALGGKRYAVELRWVRDVFTVGYVTPVPWAPAAILGVTNFRGSILPIVNPTRLLERDTLDPATAKESEGDVAVVLETDELRAAIRVDNVDEVTTLHEGTAADLLVDASGRDVPLLAPPSLLAAAMSATLTEVEMRKRRRRGA